MKTYCKLNVIKCAQNILVNIRLNVPVRLVMDRYTHINTNTHTLIHCRLMSDMTIKAGGHNLDMPSRKTEKDKSTEQNVGRFVACGFCCY